MRVRIVLQPGVQSEASLRQFILYIAVETSQTEQSIQFQFEKIWREGAETEDDKQEETAVSAVIPQGCLVN